MAKPGVSSLLSQTEKNNTFQIHANGADFFISIIFVNSKGQIRPIQRLEYNKIVFEHSYLSPFQVGQLQLIDNEQQSKFNTVLSPKDEVVDDYETLGDGAEFIVLKIDQQTYTNRCRRVRIVDDVFVTKNSENSSEMGVNYVNHYFTQADAAALLYSKWVFSTCDYIDPVGHNQERISQLSGDQKTIKVSDAVRHLLEEYCTPTSGRPIINEQQWRDSTSKIEYTSPQGDAPINALFDIMSKYISTDTNDPGFLFKYGGLYELRSFTDLINDAVDIVNNNAQFKKYFAGVVTIERDDTRVEYSKQEAESIYDNHPSVPVKLSDIELHNRQGEAAVDLIVNHSITSYDIASKTFNLYNESGSVDSVVSSFSINKYPDRDDKTLNVNKANNTKANKNNQFNLETANDSSEHYGRATLIHKILQNSDTMTINTLGNLNMTGGKFLGVKMEGLKENMRAKNIPGLWMILDHTTTLANGEYSTSLYTTKVDKFL